MRKTSKQNIIFITVFLTIVCLICVIPILTVISISLSTDLSIIKNGYSIIPKDFTTSAYKFIFRNPKGILQSYGISIFNTVVGCSVGLIMDAMVAYAISRKDYKYRNKLALFFLVPLLISGGMVPQYILISRYLKLKNTIFALILPMLVSPWYVMLLKTFFSDVPNEVLEAATVDGASEWTIFWKILVPLSKPALATIAVFIALQYWNDWYYSLLYIDKRELYNLQYRLYIMMKDTQELIRDASMSGVSVNLSDIPTESMRMAMCVVAAGPMLMVFPFFQKYFVRGLTLGSVKG